MKKKKKRILSLLCLKQVLSLISYQPLQGASPDGKVFDLTERFICFMRHLSSLNIGNSTFQKAWQDDDSFCQIVDLKPYLETK